MTASRDPGEPSDDDHPDLIRDMADPAAYDGAQRGARTLVTAVWCTGAAVLFGVFAVLAVLTGAPIAFALVCVGLAVALGLAAASAVRSSRQGGGGPSQNGP